MYLKNISFIIFLNSYKEKNSNKLNEALIYYLEFQITLFTSHRFDFENILMNPFFQIILGKNLH